MNGPGSDYVFDPQAEMARERRMFRNAEYVNAWSCHSEHGDMHVLMFTCGTEHDGTLLKELRYAIITPRNPNWTRSGGIVAGWEEPA
jgi:hypothetical protein